ncbi:MAG: DNA-binding transcriptional LysR family regulator [Flavobacteriales bacterium]|jgi:DNA-binding transcriptional LysR family regulator
MDRWDDYRLFLAVAHSGTLSAAAETLRLNVSTVQRRIARFEGELGTILFRKGPRGYELTHTGEALLPKAEEMQEAALAASRTVVGHDQQASGEVRITLPLALVSPLAAHLAEFSRVCEHVRPVLLADDVVLDLGRSTDIALRSSSQPLASAVGRELFGVAWCRYTANVEDAQRDDLDWVHYVGMDDNPVVQWRKREHASGRMLLFVQGVAGMHAVLAQSGGQGLLPCFVGDADPRMHRVGAPVAGDSLWLLCHADLRRSARVRALVDFLTPRLLSQRALFEGELPGTPVAAQPF